MGERRDLRDLLRDTDFEQRRIIDDLSSYREEEHEKEIGRDIKRGGLSDFFRNLFVGAFLVAIVIGSFWVSFLVGKRVLVPPIKNIPTIEFPRPKAVTSIQVEKAKITETAEKAKETIREMVSNVTPKAQEETVAVKSAASPYQAKKYYKVIVGSLSSSASAQDLGKKLAAKNFPYYIKKVSGMWRIQAGAFDTQSQAQALVARLKAKGFGSEIVIE